MSEKILFLDVDGVLNSVESCKFYGTFERLDPRGVVALQRIIDTTGAKLVISSTWRLFRGLDGMREVLQHAGLRAEVVGITPDLVERRNVRGGMDSGWFAARPRREEIAAWLAQHPEVTAWCALDDDPDAGPLNLVHTDDRVGLTEANADAAIALLTRGV